MSSALGVTPGRGTRMARPGPGKGWRQSISPGQAQGLAGGAHLVLEELAQRLDELELHALGQAAHVVVALDDRARALERHALDHVGVERALHEVASPSILRGLLRRRPR
jgi:hypothetical protein